MLHITFSPKIFLRISLGFLLIGSATAGTMISAPATAEALITTPGNPAGYVVSPPSFYDGVAKLIISMPTGTFGCSGSLLTGGLYVLTAAHCISSGGPGPTVNSLTATFNTASGLQTFAGAAYYVAPGWTGNFADGADIALVRLQTPATAIATYSLFRGLEPVNAIVDVAGYGLSGLGSTGVTGPFGTLRAGKNTLEGVYWTMPGNPYAWDFDDGTPQHDSLCLVMGACHTGLGIGEVMIAPGDSGGPTFFGGRLIGVHSFGGTFGMPGGDIDGALNSSFGELAGDTRVNQYAAWIDRVTVPEPGTVGFAALALGALLASARRRLRG